MIDGLRPYPDVRPTELPWLGDIPSHWEVRRGKFVFREVDNRSETGEETQLSMSQLHGLIESSKIDSWRLRSESYIGGKLCEAGDLVLNRLKAHLGVFAHAPVAGVVSPDYTVFRPVRDCDVRYFEYLYKTPLLKAELRRRTKGIVEGFWRLYSGDFYDIRIVQPPLDEQRLIVRFLDWHGNRTAKLIRAKRQALALLDEQRRRITQRAVTRGLDPDMKLKPSGIAWLGDIPEQWQVRRLKTFTQNKVEPRTSRVDGEIYVALEHIESWTGRLLQSDFESEFDSQVKVFAAGDVLFGKLRPYLAKVTRLDVGGICVGELLVLRPSKSVIDPEFLEYRMRSEDFIQHVSSSTFGAKMPRAEWDFIGNVGIALPSSLEEQRAIVAHIEAATGAISLAMSRIGEEIAHVQDFRTRLISDVVTGRLDVRELAASLPEQIESPEPVEAIDEIAASEDEGREDDALEEAAA